jgi:hypothetical protein
MTLDLVIVFFSLLSGVVDVAGWTCARVVGLSTLLYGGLVFRCFISSSLSLTWVLRLAWSSDFGCFHIITFIY